MLRPAVVALLLLTAHTSSTVAQETGNLLRNGAFQDDWITLIPENKNHHWCYSSEFYHRRDFNPDGWTCKGSWQWRNADQPAGNRKLVVSGPGAEVAQRVPWVLIHDGKAIGSMADAGGFPQISPTRSRFPERVLRDLTLRVRMRGDKVPAAAGVVELGLCPPGGIALADPFGSVVAPLVTVSVALPEGTYVERLVEVKLPAEKWIAETKAQAAKNPKEAAEIAKSGVLLPGTVQVSIRYKGAKGSVELERAELFDVAPSSPNVFAFGDFQVYDIPKKELFVGWSHPLKYRYFPGRLYYLFNTWHNGAFDNRGMVAPDRLVVHHGGHSLVMTVPPGDETAITSRPIMLNQKEPRLIEVRVWVKTDKLSMMHIDAIDDQGVRLDSFPFIHMAPHSIGTDDWRLVRQVFRPRTPLKAMRLTLCARGVNGYTLDDTGEQPQNNVVGTIWWAHPRVLEPESTAVDLAARGVAVPKSGLLGIEPHLAELDLGERKLGANVLSGAIYSPQRRIFTVRWNTTSPSGEKRVFEAKNIVVPARGTSPFLLPYELTQPCPAYQEYEGYLELIEGNVTMFASEYAFCTWTTPIDIDLGALYLRPEQKQFVRLNFGLSWATMQKAVAARLEVVRRGTGALLKSMDVPATPAIIEAQRKKLPQTIRDDLSNLLLTDLDVSFLPVQPFRDPQRNWLLRVKLLDAAGKTLAQAESPPFCRLAHQPAQPPVKSVKIKNNLLYVNAQPWMPWGVVYGHVPVYDGPADPGKYLDLHNLKPWSMYDGFTAAPYTRKQNDFNCLRYVAGSITDPKKIQQLWTEDNLYCSSAFPIPIQAFSLDDMFKKAGGKDKLAAHLQAYKNSPAVVSIAPGIEEAFGLFHEASAADLKGLEQVTHYLCQATGKPAMVGHGGYWNRFEFEKVPFFDIFDPETEPLYPANLQTDLMNLIQGKDKAIWLRPQMYESVPYERWRFHVFVELMRGCRGWQIAHGPGDPSLFRGLHGELEYLTPVAYSADPGPHVETKPALEHWSRRYNGKTYIIAATTSPLTLGHWHEHKERANAPVNRSRVTGARHLFLHEGNSYGADQKVDQGPSIHGIHHFPNARSWPKGTVLHQWVRIDDKNLAKNLVILFKSEGRWSQAASWGKFDPADLSRTPEQALWFLRSFYRHAYGFLGWGNQLVGQAKPYLLQKTTPQGALPKPGDWIRLEIPLEQVAAADKMLDGVAFAHDGGKVFWGRTSLFTPDGMEVMLWGDTLEQAPQDLAETEFRVAGLKAGTKIRVLFEDRELVALKGAFRDDFRGQNLYQRHGGGPGVGYGSAPVALHIYELHGP